MDRINKFESDFRRFFKLNHAFSFWKARVGLYAILKALDIKQDDEVILPGYTCVVNVNPIKYLGAKPIYIDIEPNTFTIDTDCLEKKVSSKTKAIIAQHTYGYTCDMNRILQIANKCNIPVIEDCCLALGSKYNGKLAGTFGDAAYFSFQWNKPFTTGLGGIVVTDDEDITSKIKELCESQLHQPSMKEILMLLLQLMVYRAFIYPATTALATNIFRYLTKKHIVVGSSKYDEYAAAPIEPDFFKAMSSVQANSGIKQLKKIEKNIEHRKKMAGIYDEMLAEKGWPTRNFDKSLMDPVMVRYPVRIIEKEKALADSPCAGIELGSWFNSPLHQIETSLDVYDYKVGDCPQAEKAAGEVVNLPLHPRTTEKTIKKVVNFITRYTPIK
jgi:perosamine synthetase